MIRMIRRNASVEEIESQKEQQKLRIKITKAARRSGKIRKKEGKVSKAKAKTRTPRSSKKIAAIKKSRY